ncbi:MAG TPA: dephospho-CoA kinase [Polyangiaceae bacterium LLY-WYZ-15_(1-7)]|nr:dephospho-CoA kinase [Sandaracinus sp.]HJL04535.1 dephospho-CoA kinase [Polyangiaceae bacterium LLY-WYZ-15_(1-7)]HJL08503.1 dephospho-CoA kinase [Polyangiaceae bacterium LLY-WYZ-15_(1-7)]HJL33292.1 dephospho-CoA kinase [Polyangiaceae bacterium LLY-WYZ-15_(1-7)]HJL39036.1 dephospho-CoA kinase [Polyangiaceae bacterium LLY-WYZ-15_(1-7)]
MAGKPTVGLTGGIASGKSTVAALFAGLGIPVVDADQLAREVVAPGTEGLAAIVETFGDAYLAEDGSLDRKKLGALVFDDAGARRKLNAITHPRIAQAAMKRMAELQSHPAPYVLYEAALLVENRIHEAFGALVVVSVDEATQVARLRERDGLSEAEARARLEAQLPLAEKVAVADYVIDNGGTREQTAAQVEAVHAKLVARFGEAAP